MDQEVPAEMLEYSSAMILAWSFITVVLDLYRLSVHVPRNMQSERDNKQQYRQEKPREVRPSLKNVVGFFDR